ncbi:DUF2812 domain-containing protein [Ihubacter massiliensis]|uniref:DUF2812 domain-containing protein n=1 Tax=Hominibacterium faecale TaxID=2839743 RepID=A0A9J6QWT8_9FIRM|nr:MULTISPECIES: DUF2812 domain-containing protein [Eubacteriales Family XIII. Incertae Sedis]MCI7303293.1 DUF2812 domain-containing protein [Clostridia bacterium]MDE8734907.1 DUF2812 domain-containing protein [Eubacteriales bacterium DFI.9.88]MDY3011955.1 DUF2812 domain-containing protein [Clostridiales Family XIII bacterium]MCO7120637.1 DUF2812 domain-containing protein [Ihubacter massiliensis]MCU7379938.1 DUF2812 domain-containing protein [Hominibacterium faecale]
MNYLYKFWPRPEIETKKKVEQYLAYMAARGYQFESAGLCLASFKKGEPQEQCYCVDFFRDLGQAKDEYLQLCGDSGWEYIDSTSYVYYFRNKSEIESPVPLHTDAQVEKNNFDDTYRNGRVGTVFCIAYVLIILCGFIIYGPEDIISEFFLSTKTIFLFYLPLVLFVSTFIYGQKKKRKIKDGNPAKRYEVFLNISPLLYLSLLLVMMQVGSIVIYIVEKLM